MSDRIGYNIKKLKDFKKNRIYGFFYNFQLIKGKEWQTERERGLKLSRVATIVSCIQFNELGKVIRNFHLGLYSPCIQSLFYFNFG